MAGRLGGKSILVAGTGGIGSENARRYAAEGASVVLGDIDQGIADGLAKDIREAGGTAIGVAFNGGDEDTICRAIARAISEYGGLDGLDVNYLCPMQADGDCDVVTIPLEDYDISIQVNQRGYLLCTRHAIPEMLKRGGGAIVYTSSDAAYMGEPVRVAYAMQKAATHALMRHVARRYGREGIRANVVAPGMVVHEKLEHMVPSEFIEAAEAQTLTGYLGRPADIAATAAFLLSDEARYITGQVINVNGGTVMRA